MTSKTFVDSETVVDADWLNDVDYLAYDIFSFTDGTTDLTVNGITTFSDRVDAGDPGLETSGIDINGVTYTTGLRVNDIGGTNAAQFVIHRHSTTLQPLIVGARTNSDTSAHASVTSGQSLFTIFGAGYTGSHYDLFGSLEFQVGTGTVSSTSSPGKYVVSLSPDGSNVPAAVMTLDSDKSAVFVGDLTGLTVNSSGDTSAGDNAAMGYTATEGLILTGQGSTNDVTFKNDADTTVFAILTGTQNVDFVPGTQLLVDRTTEDAAFVNFQATIDADATSAISSLTTSGAVTHHIQIELNGTTAWIPCSTTDPS